jgi:hypothetical protein
LIGGWCNIHGIGAHGIRFVAVKSEPQCSKDMHVVIVQNVVSIGPFFVVEDFGWNLSFIFNILAKSVYISGVLQKAMEVRK